MYHNCKAFQSTLPARGATFGKRKEGTGEKISIHAPRTGSDVKRNTDHITPLYFNPRSPHGERLVACEESQAVTIISIHAPRTGSDEAMMTGEARVTDFNPRSPHGERLICVLCMFNFKRYFNPRSPHGERPCSARRCGLLRPISIHAPRTGSDGICIVFSFRQYGRISIHAPRTGSDNSPRHAAVKSSNFNPRSPHGERRCNFNRRER